MARYLISKPAYVNGTYLGRDAANGQRAVIEVPDVTEPSLTWEPMDEAAVKAINEQAVKLARKLTQDLDPVKDKEKIAGIFERVKKQYAKKIVVPPEPKVKVRDVNTNAEITERGAGRVVGRSADRSPVE